jgi:hypothetical protein
MLRFLVAAAAIALGAPLLPAADGLPAGNWRLVQHSSATSEFRMGVLKLERKDAKLAATVLDTYTYPPSKKGGDPQKLDLKVESVKLDGAEVRLVAEVNGSPQTFIGFLNPKEPDVVRGCLGDERRVSRASLVRQDGEKLVLQPASERPRPPEPQLSIQRLFSEYSRLLQAARQAKDVNEKADFQEKAKAKDKEIEEKLPGLYRQTVEKHSDSPFAIDAAASLLRTAAKAKATPNEVETWLKLVEKDAARYGPRYEREFATTMAEALRSQKGFESFALSLAHRADKGMEKDAPVFQERVLRVKSALFKSSGNSDDAKAIEARLAKVSAALDKDYEAKVPPFSPPAFAGRKNKSANRPVVLELFTGAQCPPCVASDVAFDALAKAYKPDELILIQYHVHIPGPDPLTSEDTVARMESYRKLFDQGVGGTPSTLFNGKPEAYGGGAMSAARKKYDEFVEIINPLLEEKTDIKLSGTATRNGDKVSVAVQVDDLREPGEKTVLRLILVEESVKYVGGNALRLHHHVVRDFPGGLEGTPLKQKAAKKTVDVNLAELRKKLNAYLDKYATEHPFPYEERPMDFNHLKVVALVQNDETGEILNAVQMDVK